MSKAVSKKKITLQSNLLEVLRQYPETGKVFNRFNMKCRSCMGAKEETIRKSAESHGVDPKVMVKELNDAVNGG